MELQSLHNLLQIYYEILKYLKIVATVFYFSGPESSILLWSSVDLPI